MMNRKIIRKLVTAIAAMLVMAFTQSVSAMLVGDTVNANVGYGATTIISGSATVVDPGVEFFAPIPPPGTVSTYSYSIDIFADNTFSLGFIGYVPSTPSVDWTLSDLDWAVPSHIVDVNLLSAERFLGPTPQTSSFATPGIAFGSDWLTITQAPSAQLIGSDFAIFEIITAPIPEPSIIALFGLGVLVLGVARRRMRS